MAVSGVRAQRFLQPAPGGASAVFARQRGMVAPAPARLPAAEEKESRSGKASGRDYGNFFSKKRNVSAIQGAVNALKTLLVGTFIAAKSLGATLKGVVKQIKGMSGGGGGLFGTLGMIGLVGALIAGVAAIFGPQIKKAFEWLKDGAEGLFQDVKGRLDAADKNLEKLYNTIKDFVNVTVVNIIGQVNSTIGSINGVIAAIKPIAGFMANNPLFGGPLQSLKDLGKALTSLPTLPDPLIPQDKLPKLPEYRDVLGDNGINFLKSYDNLGSLGGAMMSGAGSMLGGGIDSMTGFVGDLINNMLASLGLTDAGNEASEYLGMGSLFGESRELGSGPGISSLFPEGSWEGLGNKMQEMQQGMQQGLGSLLGGPAQAGTGSGGDSVFDVIASGEGDYNSVNRRTAGDTPGGAKAIFGKNLTEMSVGEIMDAQASGKVFAVGKYQVIPPTMDEWVNHPKGGISRSDKFDASTQDKFKEYVINIKRPAVGRYLRGETNDPTEAGQALAREFAAVGLQYGERGQKRGQGLYDGMAGNAASIKPEEITEALKRDRQRLQAPPPAPAPAQPAPAPQGSTKTTAPPKPVSKASTIVLPGGTQVAQAPQRPRPDTAVPNISGEGGNPTIAFYSPSFPDALDINPIGAFG